jgi:hypothetical protein
VIVHNSVLLKTTKIYLNLIKSNIRRLTVNETSTMLRMIRGEIMRQTKTFIIIVTGILSLYLITIAHAETPIPGSASDPLITKSYFEKNLQLQLTQKLEEQKTIFEKKLKEEIDKQKLAFETILSSEISKLRSEQKTYFDNALKVEIDKQKAAFDVKLSNEISKLKIEQTLKVVTIKKGQTLMARNGTEFIIRAGKAIVVSNTTNGISDITVGKDLAPGVAIPNNHFLVFPTEGRGITPSSTSTVDVIVLVKGGYDIK